MLSSCRSSVCDADPECRTKKAKCGGQPPDSCPNCIESNSPCSWPESDGRSTRAKGQKRKPSATEGGSGNASDEKPPLFGVGSRSATGLGSGLPRVPVSAEGENGKGKKKEKEKEKAKEQEVPKSKDRSTSFHTQFHDDGIPDELRGMGLGMPPPASNGHDGLTSGMGFGDPFWTGTFGHPTPGSGSGNMDHST